MEIRGYSQEQRKFIHFQDMLAEMRMEEKENLSKLSEYGFIPYVEDVHPTTFGIPSPWSMNTIISVSTIMVNPLFKIASQNVPIVLDKVLTDAQWQLDCLPLLRLIVQHDTREYMVLYITASLNDEFGGTLICQSLMGGSINILHKSYKSDERDMIHIKNIATAMRHDLDLSQALTI